VKIDKRKICIILSKRGITAGDFAKMLGVSNTGLSTLWGGKHDARNLTIQKFANTLGVDVEDILVN